MRALPLELACLALVAVAHAPLLSGQCWTGDDLPVQALPYLDGLRRAVEAGAPLNAWEPRVYAGYPVLAALQSGACYPPAWLAAAFLPLLGALEAMFLLHGWLLARGTVAVARELGASRRAGLLAAGGLLLSGSVTGHLVHLSAVVGLGWTPWVLLLAVRAARRPGPLAPLGLAAAWGLNLLMAGPQWSAFAALAAVTAALVLGGAGGAARVGLGLLGGLLLGAPQLVPGLEYVGLFPRGHADEAARLAFLAGDGIRAAQLPGWVLGDPAPGELEVMVPGAAVWALALLRLARGQLDGLARLSIALALLGLFLSPGGANPLYGLLVQVPPWSLFRVPARHALLVQLGLVLLAAGGLDLLLRGQLERAARLRWAAAAIGLALFALGGRLLAGGPFPGAGLAWLAGALGVTAVGAWATCPVRRKGAGALLLALLLLQLRGLERGRVEAVPDAELREAPPLAAPIRASANPRTLDLAAHEGVPWALQVRRLRRNSGLLHGVEYFSGYEPLPPSRQEQLVSRLERAVVEDPAGFVATCRALSIAWVVLDVGTPAPAGLIERGDDAGAVLYAVEGARPLAYLLPPGGGPPVPVAEAPPPWPGAHRVVSEHAGAGRLVVATAWYPGWVAEVDGVEQPLVDDPTWVAGPPEGLYLALDLPPGRHEVELRFESEAAAIGVQLGAAAWLAWALAVWRLGRRSA